MPINIPNITGNSSNVEISVEDFLPGNYSLTVSVTDANGNTASQVVEDLLLSGLFLDTVQYYI